MNPRDPYTRTYSVTLTESKETGKQQTVRSEGLLPYVAAKIIVKKSKPFSEGEFIK
jgi:hypothetical protein